MAATREPLETVPARGKDPFILHLAESGYQHNGQADYQASSCSPVVEGHGVEAAGGHEWARGAEGGWGGERGEDGWREEEEREREETYDWLFAAARDNFVATNNTALLALLSELQDHRVVVATTGAAGAEALWIPLRREGPLTIVGELLAKGHLRRVGQYEWLYHIATGSNVDFWATPPSAHSTT
ncbi:hypothetical protein BD311DRAFT_867916 [Dichomitus squalens]|uniref:Origin recognition complex subunit 2 winged-helix domain-containing protein n=1 Tax=Dichomitus squalens TaxID=114155 RepID=A0A4Q9ME01_9APHY|nr:hypothetical protein BD311DRAFT_867916 [Dichomitus squalens]